MNSVLDRVRELFRPASDWLVAHCARLPRHTLAWASIGLALILLLSVNLFAGSALRNAKADLTQQRLFTISNGTRTMLRAIDEPISVRLYYSKRLGEASSAYGRYFERVRDFFLQANKSAPRKPVPVYVVIFGSEKEYLPYRFNDFATAYYFGGADRDYIVLGRTGEQSAQIAVHEYVHLVARHAGLKFPPWLNEGIAELYSTVRMQGDKALVGDLIPGRLQALFSEKWVPLSVIVRRSGFAVL